MLTGTFTCQVLSGDVVVCEHLSPIESALLDSGIAVTSRGQAWSDHCREWVYFDCFLDTRAIRECFDLPGCVEDHTHRGTHDGTEHGLFCSLCHDAVLGTIEAMPGKAVFPA
jgi:hypothetical protein